MVQICISLPDTLIIKISTWNFQVYICREKQHNSRHLGWLGSPCLQSGTQNVLQVPPSWPLFTDTLLIKKSVWNFQSISYRVKKSSILSSKTMSFISLTMNHKCPSINLMIIGLKAKVMGQRDTQQPSRGARMRGA